MTADLLPLGAICVALAMAAPAYCGGAAASNGPILFSASTLRDAIRGEAISHRGIMRSGPEATAFAEGYIAALSDLATEHEVWCGEADILPHEVTAHVYDYLTGLGETAESIPADAAGLAALKALAPCIPD